MSSSPPDFFPLLTEGPKNAAFLRSSQVTARTLLRGVNKVNKTQPAKSLPHRLPPASAQRLSLPSATWPQPLKQCRGPKLRNPTKPPGDVSHNGLFAQNLMWFMHHTCAHLCTSAKSIVFFFFLFSQQAHLRKPQIGWIWGSERAMDCWDPSLPSRLFLLFQTELFIVPTSVPVGNFCTFSNRCKRAGGRWENVEESGWKRGLMSGQIPADCENYGSLRD